MKTQEAEAAILAAIIAAAEAGEVCPEIEQLREIVGHAERSSIYKAVHRLIESGQVTEIRQRCPRVLRINALGIETADPVTRRLRQIIATVARTAGLMPRDITGYSRTALYLRPRFLACYLARGEGFSYQKIGEILGRDHSSAINACKRAEQMLADDPLFARLHRRTEAALSGEREAVVPFVPCRAPVPLPAHAGARFEIGDDGELQPVARDPRPRVDPMLAALRIAHPERCAA